MKSRIIEKKQLLSLSLIIALSLAVFVNWYYTNQFNEATEPEITENKNLGEAQLVNSTTVSENKENYFSKAKVNREKAHDNSIKHLENIISNSDYDDETIELAKKNLIDISNQIKTESDIENIVSAQLNTECLVTYDIDNIEVIMPKKSITDDTVVKIKDIILSKTSLSSEQIIIIEAK